MELKNEEIIEILKDNFHISNICDYFSDMGNVVSFEFLWTSEHNSDYRYFNVNIEGHNFETILSLEVNIENYDEKFSDVNKFEIDDFGIEIRVFDVNAGLGDDLTPENIWKFLFDNKVPEKYSQ